MPMSEHSRNPEEEVLASEEAAEAERPDAETDASAATGPDADAGAEAAGDAASGEGADAGADVDEQVAALRDQVLRAQAEAENVRRRAARDVESARKFALEKFAKELLPVVDSVEKSVEAAAEQDDGERFAAVREGIELSARLMRETLGRFGIESVDPLGEPFDPERHEAMTMIEAPSAEPNSVVDVLQKGYLLNGRLLRAAMVVVAKAPSN
jgi:molecular chaperone GrpE